MISLEAWALIRRLAAEGVGQRQIARELGTARAAIARALGSSAPPKYERPPAPTAFTPFEAGVRALLAEHPELPATVIAERVGWTGSITWFRDNVRPLRARYRRPDPADRLEHAAGDAVQCDLWFPEPRIQVPGGEQVFPVLVMVAAYSRFITAVMLPTRQTLDVLAGMWLLLSQHLGSVPRRLVWDNEAGIGRGGRPAEGVTEFLGTLATKLTQTRPYHPESKGVVERANQFLETSFLPAHVHRPAGLRHPDRRLAPADRAAMLPLPPIAPRVGHTWSGRLPRDYYVRIASNDYSVDPTVIGQPVEAMPTCPGREPTPAGGWWPSTPAPGEHGRRSPIPPTALGRRCSTSGSPSLVRPWRRLLTCTGTWPTTTAPSGINECVELALGYY